jgi:hypothetical protein
MKQAISALIAGMFLATLAGCATSPTVDDGRELNTELLYEMMSYGDAAEAIRPAIVRAASARDSDCSVQYELPFEVMTSYGIQDDDSKMALLRALGVNEKLGIIAAVPSSGLKVGDVIVEVAGDRSDNSRKLADTLTEARDRGEPFELVLASGRRLTISPFTLCRGHVLVASPFQPTLQQYHWAQTMHPLEVFHERLTADEAQWIVLWTQGLSEAGGARMKTYAFMVGSIKWIVVLGLGASSGGVLASLHGGGAAAAGTTSAGQVAAVQLAGSAASLMAQSAANRASLTGVSRVAADSFDQADKWAFEHMQKLGMNPRAGLSLHQKLLAQGAAGNAFLLDERRLASMRALVATLPPSYAMPASASRRADRR